MSAPTSPWPGPRPFTEEEAALLFARGDELAEIANALRTKVVVQLTAPSGAGKTSFLYAKLMPMMRAAGMLPIMYRTWGHVGRKLGTSAYEDGASLYRQVLRDGLAEEHRAGRLGSEPAFADIGRSTIHDDIEVLVESTAATKGVVLIFDQFEELYRSDRDLHDQFLEQVVEVARTHGVRQVVSLRKEYADDVRPFIAVLGNMGQSWLRMGEIDDEQRLRDVITRPAADEAFSVSVTDEAAARILSWLTVAKTEQEDLRRGRRPDASTTSDLGASRVGLIHLQALLWSLWNWWSDTDDPDGRIDLEDIESFEAVRGSGSALMTTSLRAWINAAFEPDEVEIRRQLDATGDNDDRRRELGVALSRTSTIRDQAAEMSAYLSAGGYKVTQECSQLASQCLGAQLATLGVDSSNLGDVVSTALAHFGFDAETDDFDLLDRLTAAHEAIAPILRFSIDLDAKGRIAGRSYRSYSDRLRRPALAAERERLVVENGGAEPWLDIRLNEEARRDAATELFVAFAAALGLLRNQSVIRETPRQSGALLVEIVHDAFGPVLQAWANDRILSGHWAIDAVTAVMGKDLIWAELDRSLVPTGQVTGLCWRGCWVSAPTKARMRLQELEFRDCDFAGSVFNTIDFGDVTFTDCDLTGVLFIDCSLNGFRLSDGKMAGSTFRSVTATGDGAHLVDMFGDNMVLDDVRGGPWTMENLNLDHCLIDAEATDDTPTFELSVTNGRLVHWTLQGRPQRISIQQCTIAHSTAAAEEPDAAWLVLSGSNSVVLCSFPDPVLDGRPEENAEIEIVGYPGSSPEEAALGLRAPTSELLS